MCIRPPSTDVSAYWQIRTKFRINFLWFIRIVLYYITSGRDGVVAAMTRLQWGRPRNRSSIPEKGKVILWDRRFSGLLRSAYLLVADVLGTNYRSRLQGSSSPRPLTIEVGADILYRNIGKYQSTPHNIPEERRHYLHNGGSLITQGEFFIFPNHQTQELLSNCAECKAIGGVRPKPWSSVKVKSAWNSSIRLHEMMLK